VSVRSCCECEELLLMMLELFFAEKLQSHVVSSL
jgi:hypothetical protein